MTFAATWIPACAGMTDEEAQGGHARESGHPGSFQIPNLFTNRRKLFSAPSNKLHFNEPSANFKKCRKRDEWWKMRKKSSNSVRVFYPEFTREELIEILRERIALLGEKLPLTLAALFGSWAKGNYTVASDIDLLMVYSGGEREDAFALAKTMIAVPGVEPHMYSGNEYRKMRPTVSRMLKDSITLFQKKG